MGLVGFEPTTPALSRRCSNRLSYRPLRSQPWPQSASHPTPSLRPGPRPPVHVLARCRCCQQPISVGAELGQALLVCPRLLPAPPQGAVSASDSDSSRKELIQPHLPIRLPCYDFTPIIYPTLGGWLLTVTSPTSGVTNSRGVTGGVYKARERIHRGVLIRDY